MMTDTAPAIEEGRAAWSRLCGERKTWTDWLAVGRAIQIGKAEALRIAKTNRAVGSKYNLEMGNWLRNNGLDGVSAQERYRLLRILENLTEVGTWRNNLDDATRRRLNHPNAIWSHWRRSKIEAERSAPGVRPRVKGCMPSHPNGRPVYWPQHCVRAAHEAMLKSHSNDLLVLARVALEAAIRSESDLVELLSPDTAAIRRCPGERTSSARPVMSV